MGSFKAMSQVIEVATFKLRSGVQVEDFSALDLAVKTEHISKQPGYISRESGFDKQTWVVVVHWRSLEDADASMNSFMTVPAAQPFMDKLDASTMQMSRYHVVN